MAEQQRRRWERPKQQHHQGHEDEDDNDDDDDDHEYDHDECGGYVDNYGHDDGDSDSNSDGDSDNDLHRQEQQQRPASSPPDTEKRTRGTAKNFHCYLLRSQDPKHPRKSYIGFTVRNELIGHQNTASLIGLFICTLAAKRSPKSMGL